MYGLSETSESWVNAIFFVMNLVKLGKDSVDAAVSVDESFVPLQKRLESSLAKLKKVAGEHT